MREPLFEIIYGGINMFNIFGEALWLILDKVTDKRLIFDFFFYLDILEISLLTN